MASKKSPREQNPEQEKGGNSKPLIQASYSGPLPPAAELERYNQVYPGAAEIILSSFQLESRHRQELENKYHDLDKFYIKKSTNHSLVGTWLGFGIGIAVLVLAGYFAHLGYPKSGALIATVDICGLVGTFIYGTKHKDNNRQ